MSGISKFVGKAGERNSLKDIEIWLETGKKGICEHCTEEETILWFEGMWMCLMCLIEHINETYNVGHYLEG